MRPGRLSISLIQAMSPERTVKIIKVVIVFVLNFVFSIACRCNRLIGHDEVCGIVEAREAD